jgi:hypothetical protein
MSRDGKLSKKKAATVKIYKSRSFFWGDCLFVVKNSLFYNHDFTMGQELGNTDFAMRKLARGKVEGSCVAKVGHEQHRQRDAPAANDNM